MTLQMNKYITPLQLAETAKTHLCVSLISAFVGITLPSFCEGVLKYVFSVIFMLIYALALYVKSEETAQHDGKSYTEQKRYKWKGIILPAGIYAVWLVLFVLYKFSWKYDIVSYNSGFINNLLFVVWNFIYSGFMDMNNGSFNSYAVVLIVLLPAAACFFGYFAGSVGFSLTEQIAKFVYEKKDSENDGR